MMSDTPERRHSRRQSTAGCAANPLSMPQNQSAAHAVLCGKEGAALIYCPAGHYVCDQCHSRAAMDVLRQVLDTSQSCDPAEMIEQVMAHPSVPMHGPEHHVMVRGHRRRCPQRRIPAARGRSGQGA